MLSLSLTGQFFSAELSLTMSYFITVWKPCLEIASKENDHSYASAKESVTGFLTAQEDFEYREFIFFLVHLPWYAKKLRNTFFTFWGWAGSANKNLGTVSTELIIFLLFLQRSGNTQKAEGLQQIQKPSEKSQFSHLPRQLQGDTVNKAKRLRVIWSASPRVWAVSSCPSSGYCLHLTLAFALSQNRDRWERTDLAYCSQHLSTWRGYYDRLQVHKVSCTPALISIKR